MPKELNIWHFLSCLNNINAFTSNSRLLVKQTLYSLFASYLEVLAIKRFFNSSFVVPKLGQQCGRRDRFNAST